MTDWQPIETAPKGGTPVLIYSTHSAYDGAPFTVLSARYDGPLEWVTYSESGDTHSYITDYEPTHWMPLPDAPQVAA